MPSPPSEPFSRIATDQPALFDAVDHAVHASSPWWHAAILPVSLTFAGTLLWLQWRQRRR